MTSTALYFPIAGCVGNADPAAASYDRRWLVVDEAGNWLTEKEAPRLADIVVELRFGYLVLRAPGMLRMDLPLDVIEDDDSVRRQAVVGGERVDVIDEGDLAAAWLGNCLGMPSRLFKVHPDAGPVLWPAQAAE